MVEQVEELGAELDLVRFENSKILLQDQIEVDQVRPTEITNFRIAEAVCRLLPGRQGRSHKDRLVEPAIQRLVAGVRASEGALCRRVEREIVRIGNLVGAIAETACIAQIR